MYKTVLRTRRNVIRKRTSNALVLSKPDAWQEDADADSILLQSFFVRFLLGNLELVSTSIESTRKEQDSRHHGMSSPRLSP